jgi:hypothetical protein
MADRMDAELPHRSDGEQQYAAVNARDLAVPAIRRLVRHWFGPA